MRQPQTPDMIDLTLSILRIEEAFRPWPYRCTRGVWTLGYGTAIEWGTLADTLDALEAEGALSASPSPGYRGPGPEPMRINAGLAESLMRRRVSADAAALSGRPWFDAQTPERRAILLAMAYQMGLADLSLFRLTIRALEIGDHAEAAREMLRSRWALQTPARARRQAEAMRTGDLGQWQHNRRRDDV